MKYDMILKELKGDTVDLLFSSVFLTIILQIISREEQNTTRKVK